MASLPSAQFRKTFSRLTEPVTVTSHGHLMGTWVPGEDLLGPLAEVEPGQIPVAFERLLQTLDRGERRVEPPQPEATVDNDVVAERDSLRLEVEYLNSRLAGAPK